VIFEKRLQWRQNGPPAAGPNAKGVVQLVTHVPGGVEVGKEALTAWGRAGVRLDRAWRACKKKWSFKSDFTLNLKNKKIKGARLKNKYYNC